MIHGSLRGFWCDVLSICLLDVGSWYDLSAVPQCAPERSFFLWKSASVREWKKLPCAVAKAQNVDCSALQAAALIVPVGKS